MSKIIRDMIKKRVGSMVVLGSIFSFTLSASAEEVLTWEDCVREAKKNHPDLASAAELMRQARTDEYINLSDIFPQITSSAEGARGMPSGGKTHNSYSWDVTGQQLLFDGFKTSSEVSNAFKIFKAQEYNYAVVSSNIRLDLRSAFAGLLRAQELVSLTEDIASRRRENLNLVKLRYEAGREHRGALLTADADLAQAEFEVAQAIRNVSLAQRQLTKELGRSVKKPIKAEGTFAASGDYNTTPDFENLAESTPFLRELIVRKEAARYDVLSEESDFFPQVYLDTSFGRSGTTFMPRDEGWSAGVSVSLPLFEGGSRLAEVFKTKSQYRQAK